MTDVPRLQELLQAFNAHDLDRGPEPGGTRFVGRQAVRAGLGQRFEGIPDVHYGEDEHWACGEHAVSRWLLTGTTVAGEQVRVRGCDLFDLAPDGRIRRKDSYWKIVA